MYIRRKVYSVFEDEDGTQRLFSTTDFDYDEYGDAYLNENYYSDLDERMYARAVKTPEVVAREKFGKEVGAKIGAYKKQLAKLQNSLVRAQDNYDAKRVNAINAKIAEVEGKLGQIIGKNDKGETVLLNSKAGNFASRQKGLHQTTVIKDNIVNKRVGQNLSHPGAHTGVLATEEGTRLVDAKNGIKDFGKKIKGAAKDAWKFAGKHKVATGVTGGLALAGGVGAGIYAHNKNNK